MQLVIPLSRSGEPVYRQVYGGVREAILSGQLQAGDRPPSTCELAQQLGISPTVAVLACELLHLRRVRRKNSEILLDAVQRHLDGRADMTGDAAGVHVVL